MGRGWIQLAGGCLAVALLCLSQPAQAFIEYKLPLADLIKDAHSNHIFTARIESVDPNKPSAVLKVEQDLKSKMPFRRIPINLTGDNKVKHTPELLKRIAPDLPLVCFNTEQNGRHTLLAYTNGTWINVLGVPDGDKVRWAFLHCEIYLRRTFKGTTAELQQTVIDALAGKKAPPPYDAKEKPGLGPEIERKPTGAPLGALTRPRSTIVGWVEASRPGVRISGALVAAATLRPTDRLSTAGGPNLRGQVPTDAHVSDRSAAKIRPTLQLGTLTQPHSLLGVIALPFLMPIAALLQLLFPGLLRDHWRQYQVATAVLLSQSTLIFLAWALRSWLGPRWWLSDPVLWTAVVGAALVGLIIAVVRRLCHPASAARPARVEYLAIGSLVVAGLGWGCYQYWIDERPFRDEMGVVFFAGVLGFLHLLYRRVSTARFLLSTELVFLGTLSLTGTALGLYLFRGEAPNVETHAVTSNWPMARGNEQRTGAVKGDDPGPLQPRVLWVFDPAEARGRVMFHSSPTVVDGLLYIGALHQVAAIQDGYLYCVDAQKGEAKAEAPLTRSRLWRFSAGSALRPVFSTPVISQGHVYIGEGYHQDSDCRLFCLDARDGSRVLWTKPTSSHVESSPCVVGSRIYFGAGDDGILCVDESQLDGESPKTLWQVPGLHVDVSPLVVGDRLFAGSTVGDKHQDLYAVAVDVHTGKIAWQMRNELRITGSPAHADGRVFFGLGNGKLGQDADQPQGAVWCLAAEDGRELWTYRTGNSVMATPALMDGHIFAAATDGHCYCLDQKIGQLIWKQALAGSVAASPVVAGGKVYLLTVEGVLSCLAAADGRTLWTMKDFHGAEVDDAYASPVLVDGRLYVAVGGKVYCIGDP
jgi:outer membrane protein assembly factor BamB